MSVSPGQPLACVLGTMDLVRPLGLAGVRCAVVTEVNNSLRYSRFTHMAFPWIGDAWDSWDQLVDALYRKGRAIAYMDLPPVPGAPPMEIPKKPKKRAARDKLFEANYAQLRQWVDLDQPKYALLKVRRERRLGRPASQGRSLGGSNGLPKPRGVARRRSPRSNLLTPRRVTRKRKKRRHQPTMPTWNQKNSCSYPAPCLT